MKLKKDLISLISVTPIVKMSANKIIRIFLLFFSLLFLGCHPSSYLLEPKFHYTPQKRQFQTLSSAFETLEPDEKKKDWGKELYIAQNFARELDLYRAITSYKRALFLLSPEEYDRRYQIEYGLVKSYYLGKKYWDALEIFEKSGLPNVKSSFPPFRDLLVILHDSYYNTDQAEKASGTLDLLAKGDPETAHKLNLSHAIVEGDLCGIAELANSDDIYSFPDHYRCNKLSVRKAQVLNAVLPGAGYYYVGQKRSAVTSFMINVLTSATAWYFFDQGNIAAGILATSVEFGWYIGGINGAGLAAKECNQALYEDCGKDLMIRNQLFPVLMLETSF